MRGVSLPTVTSFELPFAHKPRRVRVVVPRDVEPLPPLLVMFDGQNVLGDEGSHVGGWYAHAAITRLPSTVRRPILVAVDHGGVERNHELWKGLDELLPFVTQRVIPHVESSLRLRFDPAMRAIGGSSLGGLASLAAIARAPDLFTHVLAMSPSAWFAPEIARELVRARFSRGAHVYLDVGGGESVGMVREATRVAELLGEKLSPSRVMWRFDRRGKHRERDWKRRLPKALRFLFRRGPSKAVSAI